MVERSNPVGVLVDQMGISHKAIAQEIGNHESEVREALGTDNPEVSILLRIISAMHVRLQVLAGEPLAIAIDNEAIDNLIFDNKFRSDVGLQPSPVTWAGLRSTFRRLHDEGYSYGRITDYMTDNWIPTHEGLREWRRSTIGLDLQKRPNKDGEKIISAGDEFKRLWRGYVTTTIISQLFDFAPTSIPEYGIVPTYRETIAGILSTRPIPIVIRSWAMRNMLKQTWIPFDQWQEVK